MKSRSFTMFFLVVVFGALSLLYFFKFRNDVSSPTGSPVPTRQAVSLLNMEVSNIQEVTWKFNNQKATLQKSGSGEWKLVEPGLLVDKTKVDEFISSVAHLSGENKYLFSELPKDSVGFSTPSLTLSVNASSGKSTILVGKKTVDGDYYYVTKDGEDYTTLVYSYTVEALQKDPYSLTPGPSGSPSPSP